MKFNYSTKSVSMFFLPIVPESLVARSCPGDGNLINIFTFYDATFPTQNNKLLMANCGVESSLCMWVFDRQIILIFGLQTKKA